MIKEIQALEKIRLDKRVTLEDFSKELGITRRTYTNWKTSKKLPNELNMHAIKKYLNEQNK